jgi:hypothetical protein
MKCGKLASGTQYPEQSAVVALRRSTCCKESSASTASARSDRSISWSARRRPYARTLTLRCPLSAATDRGLPPEARPLRPSTTYSRRRPPSILCSATTSTASRGRSGVATAGLVQRPQPRRHTYIIGLLVSPHD